MHKVSDEIGYYYVDRIIEVRILLNSGARHTATLPFPRLSGPEYTVGFYMEIPVQSQLNSFCAARVYTGSVCGIPGECYVTNDKTANLGNSQASWKFQSWLYTFFNSSKYESRDKFFLDLEQHVIHRSYTGITEASRLCNVMKFSRI